MVNCLSHASPQVSKAASGRTSSGDTDVVHLVVGRGSNLKQIFDYCPFPALPTEHSTEYAPLRISGIGVYRLMVDQQGKVTEIKILKKMGALGDSRADVTALKTFVRWRAKLGPKRIVDVSWGIPPDYHVITTKDRTGSHIPAR
jgi:hypothetical protein